MNEKKIYIARLKAYKCMLNLPRLAENYKQKKTNEQKKNGPARSPWDQ